MFRQYPPHKASCPIRALPLALGCGRFVAHLNDLQQQLQNDFINRISPVLQTVATDRKLQVLFNASDAGFAWVDPGLDLTDDVIQKLDAASKATK